MAEDKKKQKQLKQLCRQDISILWSLVKV